MKEKRRGYPRRFSLFLFLPLQLFQMIPQREVDIAGDGTVVIFCQTFYFLIDWIVKCNTDSYF